MPVRIRVGRRGFLVFPDAEQTASGGRIFAHIPKKGYVGVEKVTGPVLPYDGAVLEMDGEQQRFTDLPLQGSYARNGDQEDRTLVEYVVPVAWTKTCARDDAVWQKDLFWTSEPLVDGGDLDGGGVANAEFAVARGYGPVLLEPVDRAFLRSLAHVADVVR